MSNKPIISVDVNDRQFKAFYDLFSKYKTDVEEMPKSWAEVDKAVAKASKSLNSHSWSKEDFKVMAREMEKAADSQKKFHLLSLESSLHMKKMADSAKSLSSSMFDIGKWMLKLGAIGGGIAGLGGILGAISLRDLAHSAVTEQRGARGVGLTPGQYKAFGMDFGRFLDPSILSHVADAQNSYQGRVWLGLATGLGAQAVANQGPDQLAMRLATRAHDWWTKTPASQRTAENLAAAGFTQSGLTLEDVRRLGNTPMSELQAARAQYGRDQRSLNVSNGTTQAWYEFDRQITLAGRTLETSLTNRLVELAPSLRSFVTTLTKDADQLINDIFTPKNLKAVEDGITGLTNYLGSPTFQQDMRDFAGLIGLVAGAIRKAARFFGIDTSSTSNADVGNFDLGSGANDWSTGGISPTEKALGYTRHALTMPGDPAGYLANIEKQRGLPPGTLSGMWKVESNSGKNLVGPLLKNGDQAIGDLQFTSGTWNDWGNGGDRFSFKDQAGAAGRYMQSLMKKYGGDIRKALAAYNWGPGNLDKDIAKNGAQWESNLPAETRKYIAQIAGEVAKRNAVKVQVQVSNNTSARVAVQANAAAPGF
ncbi:transglycosylase SLT domain protein [Burkholderia multivorans]|uniref:lytic transglycosylase domain-containing protein n=1 Tax=Burkholderia multivorans TaxID=87883 RepID=UPI00050F50E1|nr:lytic transglycosylase domain-containing protein [Burkholderia multivorans]KGC02869.1 transglycosylase SLT domain protein [Burkholderia multivorans]